MIKKTTPQNAAKVNFEIDGRIMHTSEKTEAILLTLQPGEKIPAHTNPCDVLFIGMLGEVCITAGNQDLTLAASETIFITREESRQAENTTSSTCRMMVVKVF